MSQPHPPRMPPLVRRELEGLDWSLVRGRRHWRLIIGGEQVAVFGHPFSHVDMGSDQITASAIRRWKRRHEEART